MPAETKTSVITFQKNGDLTFEHEGADVVVAHFDSETGHLEYEKAQPNQKLQRQVTAAIGTIEQGMKPSGLVIKSMGVKGQKIDKFAGKIPPKPKRDKMFGDQTPAIVEWYFKYYPQEAYIRYGVFLDQNGEPQRRTVKRKMTEIVDDRSGDIGLERQNDGKGVQVGAKKWENGPIGQVASIEQLDNQIVARRGTHMTFTPKEVVGGFAYSGDDDGEEHDEGDEEGGEE